MSAPDPSVLPAVRTRLEMAEEQMRIAMRLMRDGGWPGNADELGRSLAHLRVWTLRDGWLDALAREERG